MRRSLLPDTTAYTAARRRRQRWYRVVTALAAVVVFCTTYALILPAITLEADCGIPAHTHDRNCYQPVEASSRTVLSCHAAQSLHVHEDACYDGEGSLVCGYGDAFLHTHDALCYDEAGNLVCPLPELLPHEHTEDCYPAVHTHTPDCYTPMRGALICTEEEANPGAEEIILPPIGEITLPVEGASLLSVEEPQTDEEAPGHVHANECYAWTTECTCGLEETPLETLEPLCGLTQLFPHVHEEDCYDAEGNLCCGLLEVFAHRHEDSCFETVILPTDFDALTCETTDPDHEHTFLCYGQWELVCPLEEHRHSAECYPPEEEALPPEEDAEEELPEDPLPEDAEEPAEEPVEEPVDEPSEELPPEETLYFCGLAEHQHSELCFSPEGLLCCGLEAHTHDDSCLVAEEDEAVAAVIAAIDALPTQEEMAALLGAYEDAADEEGYNACFAALQQQAQAVYADYCALTPEQQALVSNADTLYALEWLWGAETLHKDFTFDKPTEVPSASTRDFIELNLYDYSKAVNTEYYNKNNKYPGFQWNGGAYMAGNSFNRHKVDYIDFGNSNITDIGYGGSSTSIANGLSENAVKVTSGGTGINAIDNTSYGVTNRPIGMSTGNDVLSRTLVNGYPALADGTSLSYLFTAGSAVTKKNNESVDGLFQKDETTGAYYYNSRWNHAQYSNNKFTLYDQIITPNFIVYPFGNFLPFNTITDSTKATQVGSLDGSTATVIDYVQKIINDLYDSNSAAYQNSPTKQQLFNMLAKYRNDVRDNTSIKSAKDAIVDYFTAGGGSGDKPSSDTSPITNDLLKKMYNIDWDEETNFFFGMEMKMNFMQPRDGLTGNDGQQPMVFYFTGDDDVWVYIDGVLFLDLSGIHRHVGGEIDFVNGVVKYYALDTKTGDVSTTPYKTYTFKKLLEAAGKSTDGLNATGTFKNHTTHSFRFYYMERGSGSSVCRMNFNFPLLRENSISVSKELSVDREDKIDLLGNPDFKFQVLKEDGKALFIGANTSYEILDANGNPIGEGTTNANGIFTLKAGQTALFSNIEENAGRYFVRELLDTAYAEQYGSVSVDGSSTTTNYDVTVGSDNFKGVDSPVKDMSDGSTVFRFDNTVTFDKLGSLSIGKKLEGYPQNSRIAQQFTFEITLDGQLLPQGTAYTVTNTNGESSAGTVTTAGQITLAADETATISNILAGTAFTVKESDKSAEGYVPKYTLDGVEWDAEPPVKGIVPLGNAVQLTVTNAENGTSVDIPVEKQLNTPDGREHTYTFLLEQVTSSTDPTPIEGGTRKELQIAITTDPVQSAFTVDYPVSQLETLALPCTFYYRITEKQESDILTVYDDSVYVVEVTVGNASETGDLTATVTQVWKNGEERPTSGVPPVDPVVFVNTIRRYELPQTGGGGTLWYTIGGTALLLAAGWLRLYQYKKRRREDSASP